MINSGFKSDRAASVDALSRLPFATSLSRSLTLAAGSPGVVIGIEGDWGSGKSTVIQLVLSALRTQEEVDRPIVVEFNPWMISSSGNLIELFLLQLARSVKVDPVGERAKCAVTVSRRLLEYGAALRAVRFARYLPGIADAGEGVRAVIDTVAAVGETIQAGNATAQAALDQLEKLLPTMSLPEKKDAVERALRDMDRPILIVIDDLDRLLPDEMRTVFQMVKAVADFPRVAYLIAYDKKVVAESLSTYGITGASYLEKIVQVAYPVPPIFGWRMHQFLANEMEAMLSSLSPPLVPYEVELWKKATRLAADLCLTPRDAVRLSNRLMISMPATRGNVNAADVLVFEAVAQRFGDLRDAILRHPREFTGFDFRDIDAPVELEWIRFSLDKKSDKDEWMRHLPEDPHLRLLALQACYFLFPKLRGVSYGPPQNDLRIADPDRLARLFALTSLEIFPEASQVHALLANASDLDFEIQNVVKDEDLVRLLEWAATYLPSAHYVDVSGCVRVLASEASKRKAGMVDDMAQAFGELVTRLLARRPPDVVQLFNELVDKAILCLAEDVLMLGVFEHGLGGFRPRKTLADGEQRVLEDRSIVVEAMQRWCARVELASETVGIELEPSLHSILFRLAQLGSFSRAYAVIRKLKENDAGLAHFVDEFPHERAIDGGVLTIVEDAEVLASEISARLKSTPRRDGLLRVLRNPEVIAAVGQHAMERQSSSTAIAPES
ncbi:KAP family P-loop NTPase fold protein [Cupriavidus alkaliphilus]|uniref:KAP family P-loop NTPase fold protein n=1 Tax=Cupriavidus alkaliphilus TaxID=942866 RepID=UPI001622DBE7|nr:P-loop NTPase fold protein [Cupriavidus alkaliphilus]MBB3014032.1 hypothetical protein [Cupriavidus alkaliphilus]